MKSYKITNFVIVALVIAAVLQTGELWLQGTSNHNFFYTLTELPFLKKAQADGDILLATRYAIGEGEGLFSVYYPDQTGDSRLLEAANDALGEILTQAEGEVEKGSADWKQILRAHCIVLQYDFMIAFEEYLGNYGNLRAGQALQQFDYITLVPAQHNGEESLAYFVNSETNEYVLFRGIGRAASVGLYDALRTDKDGLLYISTGEKTSASVLWRNLFLPQWAYLPYHYAPLTQEFVFEREGEVSRSILESTVEKFFRNFSVGWSDQDENGVFVFSDSETVVKYHPEERVLEYYSYENYGNDGKTGLLEGYQICCNFLQNDTSLQTDIYLADIERTVNNEIIYSFDYAVEDLPVNLSQNLQDRIGANHAIEVTLRNQMVKEYRRYAVNYRQAAEETEQINVQFIDALDDANKTYQAIVEDKDITDVKNITLGYHVDLTGNIRLKWFVTLYEYLFVVDTDQAKDLTGMGASGN